MAQTAGLKLERIYIKDLSFESPRSPEIFAEPYKPRIKLDINSHSKRLDEERFEVTLTVTVEARDESEQVGFIVEVQQAGVFHIRGLADDPLKRLLGTFCPNTLFPYVRETIDSLVVKGGFPALALAPVNFDTLYERASRQQQDEAESDAIRH